MLSRRKLLFSFIIAVFGVAGLVWMFRPVWYLSGNERMTLYSIDFRRPARVAQGETFGGYAVFGKIEVTDAKKRRNIASALNAAFSKKNISQAKCFWPRHAIRVSRFGSDWEYVICFSCRNAFVSGKGAPEDIISIADDPAELLNNCLTEAGIEIAP